MESRMEIKSLSAGYENKMILKDIYFTIHPGEILAIIGPNGAGKSTLLRTISGQQDGISGDVLMEDESVFAMDADERAKKISTLFTGQRTVRMMNCFDMVAMGRYPYTGRLGILSDHDREVVFETMKKMRLEDLASELFEKLSDGQKQRVLLARAICQEPEILILDEPVTYLDIGYQIKLMDTLRALSNEGISVVTSMHELSLVKKYADRLLCIKGGRVKEISDVETFFENGDIERLFDIPVGSL